MRRLNKTFISGLVLGLVIIVVSVLWETAGSNVTVFLHPIGALIVFGGCFASALISLPIQDIFRCLQRTYYCIAYPKSDFIESLREVVRMSVGVNRDVLYLEREIGNVTNAMFVDGLNLIIMGFKADDVRRFLEIKREQNEASLSECSVFFLSLAKIGPAFGLLGTLVGLIVLLYFHMGEGNMEKVASSMGIALTATLYGVGLSNLIFAPLAEYVQYNAERGYRIDSMIIEAVSEIKERRHPVYLLQALKSYLPREDYASLDEIMRMELNRRKPGDKPSQEIPMEEVA